MKVLMHTRKDWLEIFINEVLISIHCPFQKRVLSYCKTAFEKYCSVDRVIIIILPKGIRYKVTRSHLLHTPTYSWIDNTI